MPRAAALRFFIPGELDLLQQAEDGGLVRDAFGADAHLQQLAKNRLANRHTEQGDAILKGVDALGYLLGLVTGNSTTRSRVTRSALTP